MLEDDAPGERCGRPASLRDRSVRLGAWTSLAFPPHNVRRTQRAPDYADHPSRIFASELATGVDFNDPTLAAEIVLLADLLLRCLER